MAKPGDGYELPGGVKVRILQTPAETEGRRLELEGEVPPKQRLVAIPHRHMDVPEHFAIVRGTARHWLGRRRLVAHEGDAWVVPPGTTHIHPANVGTDTLVVRQWLEVEPRQAHLLTGLERYFDAVAALAAHGKVDRFGRITDPLQDALTVSETLNPGTYFPLMPIAIQRAFITRVAKVARKRGRVAVPT